MARKVHVLVWLAAALWAPAAATCQQKAAPVEIEVLLFAGGEGMEFFLQCAREYEKLHPGVRVNLSGDPRMEDKVKIRILEGTFPEVTSIPDGSAAWNLIREGYVLAMDEMLDGPGFDGGATWRSSFLPGSLDRFTVRGKTYAVPLGYWVFAMWYNKAMFEQHGWTPPRTWEELFALCGKVKAAGIAPIAFQGSYPSYANSLVQAGYYHLAGPARFAAMLNLEPGSFDNGDFRRAAALTQRLAREGFQPGSMGMSHTEAQMQFFLGKTAMIECGSWLKSEMLGKIPDGFHLGTFNLPVVEGGKGDPTAIQAANGYYWVFKNSRHPREGADFLRFMTSRKMAGRFSRLCDQPSAVRGSAEGNLSADLQDLVALIERAKSAYGPVSGEGFPEMEQHWTDMISRLVTDKITPDQAARAMEEAAESVRNRAADPDRVTVRHVWKPLILLGALGGGAVYVAAAAVLAFRKGRRAGRKDLTAGRMSLRWPSVLLFVGPAVLLYTAFVVVPSVQSLGWSTQRWDGLTKMTGVGLLHFRRLLFESDGFWMALKNNLFIMLVIPLFILPLSLLLAGCISRAVFGSAFFRVVFFFPNLMGGVAATLLWMHLYNPQGGPVNALLAWSGETACSCGLTGLGEWLAGFKDFAWLSADHLYWALVPMSVWGACGFYMVLFLAAMQGIPRDLYEAAEIDGASPFRQFRDITLPLLREVIAIATVFLVIGGMKAFEIIWLLTNQRPASATHVVGTKMVYAMFNEFNVGEASAIAVLLFLMVFFGTAVTLRLIRRERVEFYMSTRTNSRPILLTACLYALLLAGVAVVVYPMFWLLFTSLKADRDIFLKPLDPPAWDGLQWVNFTNAWEKGHFGEYFLNSAILTAGTVVLTVLLAAMAAYALSRFRFRGVRPVFFYFLAGLMVPLQLAIVPLFFEMKAMGLLDSRLGLLAVYVAFGLPFSIFVLTGFFKSLPASLHEAALLDGAGEFGAFWRVMLPLARPGLITVGIFTFLGTWNEFLMAFMFLSGRDGAALRTLPLGLADVTITSQYRSDWGMAFAGLVLMMAPTLAVYILLQKHLVKGITVGAIKG